MRSAHQKLYYIASTNLLHSDTLGGVEWEYWKEFAINFLLDGYVTKLEVSVTLGTHFNNGANASFLGFIHPDSSQENIQGSYFATGGEQLYTQGVNEFLFESYGQNSTTMFELYERSAPSPFYFNADAQMDQHYFIKEFDIYKPVKRNEYYQFGIGGTTSNQSGTYSAGELNVEFILTFVVGAHSSYAQGTNVLIKNRDFRRVNVVIFGTLNSGEEVKWIPPNDGRIGNVRMTNWKMESGNITESLVTFGYGRVGSITDEGLSIVSDYPGYRLGYNRPTYFPDEDETFFPIVTNYSRKKLFCNRSKPLIIRNNGSIDIHALVIEFDFIGDYKNNTKRMFTNQITENVGSVNYTKGYIIPEDLYVQGIEQNIAVAFGDDDDGLVQVTTLLIKQEEYNSIPTLTDLYASGNMLSLGHAGDALTPAVEDLQLDSGAIIDVYRMKIRGSNDSGGAATEYDARQNMINVGMFVPAGSMIMQNVVFTGLTAPSSGAEVKITNELYASIAYKSNDFGKNILDGSFILREEVLHSPMNKVGP